MNIDSERQERLLSAICGAQLDAVVVSAATDVLLLTGYWPVMAMSIAVLTSDGKLRVLIPEDELDIASKVQGLEVQTYKPETLKELRELVEAIRQPLGELLEAVGLRGGKIGLREDLTEQPSSYVVSSNFHRSLSDLVEGLVPAAKVEGCDRLLEKQKAAKTAIELERMDCATSLAGAGFAAASGAIQAGVRETDVAAAIQFAFDSAGMSEKVQRSYGSFYCMSGPNSATASAAYARTRERKIEEGDRVMIHANTCADGYWTDITRTYTVGPASEKQLGIIAAVKEAREAALATVEPGVRASDVDAAARKVMAAHGLGDAFKHSTGHGVGFAAANGVGRPRIHPLSPDVLEEGMTFNIEPAAYFDGYGGVRHCDLVAVTTNGVRVMTDF